MAFPTSHSMAQCNGVVLYANFGSGVTAGKLFWPRLHTDPDFWYTVLVSCLDYGKGIIDGGDFICINWKSTFMQAWG